MVVFIRLFGKKVLAVEPPAAMDAAAAAPLEVPPSPGAQSAGGGALCGWLGWMLPLCDDT